MEVVAIDGVTYNARIRTFSDGAVQVFKSSKSYHRMSDDERDMVKQFDDYIIETFKATYGDHWWVYYAEQYGKVDVVHDGSTVERKKIDNRKRAIQKIYAIAKDNDFDWFVTFTLNPDKVDRYSYDACASVLMRWMDYQRKKGLQWLIVPEQHEDGAYHFHALVKGRVDVTPALNPYTGEQLYSDSGLPIYNLDSYAWGHTTATQISDRQRTASYLCKYITKELTVPKGRKSYWASKSLSRPADDFVMMSDCEFGEIVGKCRYFKDSSNKYGDFWLAEVAEENR